MKIKIPNPCTKMNPVNDRQLNLLANLALIKQTEYTHKMKMKMAEEEMGRLHEKLVNEKRTPEEVYTERERRARKIRIKRLGLLRRIELTKYLVSMNHIESIQGWDEYLTE